MTCLNNKAIRKNRFYGIMTNKIPVSCPSFYVSTQKRSYSSSSSIFPKNFRNHTLIAQQFKNSTTNLKDFGFRGVLTTQKRFAGDKVGKAAVQGASQLAQATITPNAAAVAVHQAQASMANTTTPATSSTPATSASSNTANFSTSSQPIPLTSLNNTPFFGRIISGITQGVQSTAANYIAQNQANTQQNIASIAAAETLRQIKIQTTSLIGDEQENPKKLPITNKFQTSISVEQETQKGIQNGDFVFHHKFSYKRAPSLAQFANDVGFFQGKRDGDLKVRSHVGIPIGRTNDGGLIILGFSLTSQHKMKYLDSFGYWRYFLNNVIGDAGLINQDHCPGIQCGGFIEQFIIRNETPLSKTFLNTFIVERCIAYLAKVIFLGEKVKEPYFQPDFIALTWEIRTKTLEEQETTAQRQQQLNQTSTNPMKNNVGLVNQGSGNLRGNFGNGQGGTGGNTGQGGSGGGTIV